MLYLVHYRSIGKHNDTKDNGILRELRIREMIQEREAQEDKKRAEIFDRRKTEAILDATSIENDILKNALFNNSVHPAAKYTLYMYAYYILYMYAYYILYILRI